MTTSTQVTNATMVRSVEALRRADAQFTRRLLAMRAPNDTDRAAMRFIAESPVDAPATPGGLAAHLGVSTAAITTLIRRLQDRGQIVVAPHPADARSKVLRPSLRDIHSPVDELSRRIEALAEEFTDEQAAHVTRFLSRLVEEIDALPE